MSKTHKLKTWPFYFRTVECGAKTFEIRKNDRGFKPGDTVILREWDNETGDYTGNEIKKTIGTVITGETFVFGGIEKGMCVFSLLH